MKKIIIFYFIFLSVLVHAQNFQNDTDILKGKIIEFEKSGNINTEDYFITLNNLAYAYQQQGKYLEAEPLFLKVYEKNKNKSDTEPLYYAASCFNLAFLYYEQGKYSSTESLLLIFLDIYKKEVGEFHEANINPLSVLARVYQEEGRYSESEYLFLKAKKITEKTIQDKPSNYAASLSNLALLYQEQGKYIAAEDLYLKAIEISKKYSEKKPLYYASDLHNLAFLYEEQGKYIDAEHLYLNSLQIQKEILGEKHPDYLSTLSSLAVVYHDQGKVSEAEALYLKTLEIRKEILGEKHPDYASSLNNLAILYNDESKYSEAIKLYLQSLEILKNNLGEGSSRYFKTLTSLALLYQKQGNYSEVEPLLLKSLEIKKKILGEKNPTYILNLYHLAHFYRIIGNDEQASIYFDQFTLANQNRIIDDIYSLTEKELINYIYLRKEQLFSSLSFLKEFPTKYPNSNVGFYENELLIKNLSLHNQQRIKKMIKKSGSQSVKDKYEQFIFNKRKIIKLEGLPLVDLPPDFATLTSETKKIEKELVRESSEFSSSKEKQLVSWEQVKNKLKKEEVSIDIVAYNYYKNKKTDSIFYGVFLVKKEFKTPKFISLFEQKQLRFLTALNKTLQDSTRINKQYIDQSISNLFLKPLQHELKGITTIYLSPTGLGNQIDFTALPINENQTLGEKYMVHVLSSPSELIDYKTATLDKKSNIELLLYGGIDYNKSTPKANLEKQFVANLDDIASSRTRSGITGFDYIDGTNKEVNQIQLKGNQNGFTTTIFKESDATKESILQLDGRTTPYVLHLATHGFFFPNPIQEVSKDIMSLEGKVKIYKASEDSMMRSGLVFAGANNYWNNTNDDATIDNGILTASEISNLDLSACQLVVLSACETGLGEVKGSEGVFGLQRAFKMAGVKNIIMSLWKVPDTQTAELFDIFYGECFTGKSIHEAFQSAQSQMKAKYPPYYWAGFMLLE